MTGSVAAVSTPKILEGLQALGAQPILVTTACGQRFWQTHEALLRGADTFSALEQYTDDDEWKSWKEIGDPVLHVQLRERADGLLFAPLSANTLAKLAGGLCDNLATCLARAWDLEHKPFVVAPAMNTMMWRHPLTAQHVASLEAMGVVVVPPVRKTLACGDFGMGAMADANVIVASLEQRWKDQIDLGSWVKRDAQSEKR